MWFLVTARIIDSPRVIWTASGFPRPSRRMQCCFFRRMCQDPFTKYRHDRTSCSGIMLRKCSIRSRRRFSRNNRRFSISKKTGPRLFICMTDSFSCAVDLAKKTTITYTLATRPSSWMLRMDRSRDCRIWWSSDRLTECAAWLTMSTAAVVWTRGGAR